MESISSLKKKNSLLDKERNDLLSAVHSDPKVVETYRAYEKAMEVYRESIKGRLEEISKERIELNAKIDAMEKQEYQAIPPEVNDFIGKLYAGVEGGGYTVKWVSPSKRFIIATESGHMYWSGRGQQSYAKSEHSLFDRSKIGDAAHGCDVGRNCQVFSCEGRFAKETLEKWKAYAMLEEIQPCEKGESQ